MKLVAFVLIGSLVFALASAECKKFYSGLCPGAADCKCTLGEKCGAVSNLSAATKDGACSGQCRKVLTGKCPGAADCMFDNGPCSEPPKVPTRDAIISCALDWIKREIPYCQCNGPAECCGTCPYCGSTRCDCSGYVSHCWGFTKGYTTWTLPDVSHSIEKEQLLPGDVILCVAEHVVIFAGWADNGHTTYVAYQEPGCHGSGAHHATKTVQKYPYSHNPTCFKPRRLNGLSADYPTNMASNEDVFEALANEDVYSYEHEAEAKQSFAEVRQLLQHP